MKHDYILTRWIFLRLLGVIYLIAFISLWVQIEGLIGSNDGESWLAYEFKWKPGNLQQRPRFVAPHQPRLDWQMWFAALSSYQRNSWLINFMMRLSEGSPQVVGLLKTNPFPDNPPRFIRAVVYDYHFTDFGSNAWWQRGNPQVLYSPVQ